MIAVSFLMRINRSFTFKKRSVYLKESSEGRVYMDYTITKRLMLYVAGLFLLALGSTFSIIADLGVSPVTSLAYALALTTGLSVGIMTVVANVIYIIFQVIF